MCDQIKMLETQNDRVQIQNESRHLLPAYNETLAVKNPYLAGPIKFLFNPCTVVASSVLTLGVKFYIWEGDFSYRSISKPVLIFKLLIAPPFDCAYT